MTEFNTGIKTSDLNNGDAKALNIDGKEIAIFNSDGNFYAIENVCPHKGVPLDDGPVENGAVVCSWHGAEFDLRTGKVLSPPATCDLPTYKVKIDDEEITLIL